MDKENVEFIYKETVFSLKKQGDPNTATTWMNFEDILEISQEFVFSSHKKTNSV